MALCAAPQEAGIVADFTWQDLAANSRKKTGIKTVDESPRLAAAKGMVAEARSRCLRRSKNCWGHHPMGDATAGTGAPRPEYRPVGAALSAAGKIVLPQEFGAAAGRIWSASSLNLRRYEGVDERVAEHLATKRSPLAIIVFERRRIAGSHRCWMPLTRLLPRRTG